MGSLVLTDSAECLACACSCLRRNFGRRLGVTFTLFAQFLHGHESDTNQSESGAPAWKMTNQADSWTRFDESGDQTLGEFGTDASICHLMTHASFKAALFLSAGVIIMAAGGSNQHMARYGGLSAIHCNLFCFVPYL